MNGIRCLCALALLAGIAGATESLPENKLPAAVRTALEKADTVELFSLNGATNVKDGWHGAKVLGKTTIRDKATRTALAKAVKKGVDDGKDGARCFIPRHGLRMTHAGTSYDVLICFECHWLYIYTEGTDRPLVLMVSESPQKELNKILKASKVPLAEPEKKEK